MSLVGSSELTIAKNTNTKQKPSTQGDMGSIPLALGFKVPSYMPFSLIGYVGLLL